MKNIFVGMVIGVALNIGMTIAAVSVWDADGNKWRYISQQIQENCAVRIPTDDRIVKYGKIECGIEARFRLRR
jgi:hypothetical protein